MCCPFLFGKRKGTMRRMSWCVVTIWDPMENKLAEMPMDVIRFVDMKFNFLFIDVMHNAKCYLAMG